MDNLLFGAIGGDIAGSTYEGNVSNPFKTNEPNKIDLYPSTSRFTDDTVCTLGIADALLHPDENGYFNFAGYLQKWGRKYPGRSYGGNFSDWINAENPVPYNSWGNGSAMRVSPIGYYAKDIVECRILAMQSAMCSHNHPEGIRGAVAIAEAVWQAVNGYSATFIEWVLEEHYPGWMHKKLDEIRVDYKWDVSCQGSVPVAILCFLQSNSYEEAIRNAISLGGDSDTIGAMAGSIAYPFYEKRGKGTMSKMMSTLIKDELDEDMLTVCKDFDSLIYERFK